MLEDILEKELQEFIWPAEEFDELEEKLADCGVKITGEGSGTCGTSTKPFGR